MTKRTNIKVTDCETDTKSQLRSDHYPIIANINVKFKATKQTKEKEIMYNKKKRWTDQALLNNMLDEINKYNDLTSYTKWIKAYNDTTIAQEEKEPKKYREYISEKTKWLIDQRDNAQEEGRIEEERSLSKQIKKRQNR